MPENPQQDDQLLVQYLLGALPEEQAERLDELSVADSEFASVLSAVEYDLLDAYARGELSGETLKRFESFYLASPSRQEKATFAETFVALEQRAAAVAERAASTTRQKSISPEMPAVLRNLWHFIRTPRLTLQWAFAGAALLIALSLGFLRLQELRLRNQLAQTETEREALVQRERELQRQLEQQQSADAHTVDELRRLRESLAQLERRGRAGTTSALSIAGFLLLPATRGAGPLPSIAIPKGTDVVALHLGLESDDYPNYRIVLKDPATLRTLWRSKELRATISGENKAVSVALPAGLLKQRNYSLELTGIPARGATEFLSSYSFKVELE